MGAIFEILVLLVIVVFVLGGLMSMLGRGSPYEQIGKGGLSISDYSDEHSDERDPQASDSEREQEIRQMLEARSERRQRQGEDPLDIDAELTRLEADDTDQPGTPGTFDPGLIEETRQLIEARNQRRVRAGLDALDVQAEVIRTLKELGA